MCGYCQDLFLCDNIQNRSVAEPAACFDHLQLVNIHNEFFNVLSSSSCSAYINYLFSSLIGDNSLSQD